MLAPGGHRPMAPASDIRTGDIDEVTQLPDAQRFGHAPGLGIATAPGVRNIAIQNFRHLSKATLLQQAIKTALDPLNVFNPGKVL